MDYEIHLRRILVPTDFSEYAEHAFLHAATIARWSGAELVVIHVVEKFMDHSLLYSDVWPFQKPVQDYYRDLEEQTAGRLTETVRESVGPDVRFRVIVTNGRPSFEIAAAAQANEVDMIVIATHGRGGLAKALLGSTTERVLRKAECPVLVMRAGEEGFLHPKQPEGSD
ncbi:MAG: universal stress protein [Planctomycetota bacterium]